MRTHYDRRAFLNVSARGAAAAAMIPGGAALSLAASQKEPTVNSSGALSIVDTHQHLWDLTKFNLPWTKDEKKLARSFVTKDYLAATQGLSVVKTVYMEVDVEPSQQVQEAEYVIDLCRRNDNPMVAAVISGRPASAEFKAYITKFKDSPYIKGVRQVLHGNSTPAGFCLDKQFVKSVQVLGELGMSFDLCMRSGELADGEKLVAQCPKTRFIVDHCGNMSVQETDQRARQTWMDGMKALAQRDNVVCKISGIIASAKEDWNPADLAPNMRFSMETVGPDRRMFAGDWPVCTLRASFRQWVEALKEIVREMDMPPADQKKLFHDNAVKFYGLKDKGYKVEDGG
jgi:L-fuconolactonase